MALLSPPAKHQFLDNTGAPAAGAKLYTYAAGTTTPRATFLDRQGLAPNTNPVVLDSRGEAVLYLAPGEVYDYVLKAADGSIIWTRPGVSAGDDGAAASMTATFGAVGDNVTDNTAAFTAAEASSYQRIYLPEGTYYHSGPMTLKKFYHGPGVIRGSAVDYAPARYTYLSNRPFAGTGTGYNKFFSADLTSTEASYFINRAPRVGHSEPYYAPETSQTLAIYDNGAGASGVDARLTVAAPDGAEGVTVNSAAGFVAGDVVTLYNPDTGFTSAQLTLESVIANVLYFTGSLTAPATFPVGSQVSKGPRTMHSMSHLELLHSGGGDAYLHLQRVYVGAPAGGWPAGKDHVFFTNTGGIDGGDMVAQADGVYMTGREILFDGLSYDCAVYGDIRTFVRNNATGARGAFWNGVIYKSEGTAPCDAAVAVAGRWNAALDTTRGYFADNGGCAINMGGDQYQYFNSQQDASELYPQWGKLRGNTKWGYNTTNSAMELTVNGALAMRMSDGKVALPVLTEIQDRIYGTNLHNHPSGIGGVATQFVGSGTYTPTLTNTTNVGSSTAFACQYMRVGRVVTVSGQVTITPTTASTSTVLGVSLPIASDLAGARELGGVACCGAAAGMVAQISADPTNERALLTFVPPNNTANNWSFSFTYLVS